jgi:hypothetical protein
MSKPQFESWNLATASPSLIASSLPASSFPLSSLPSPGYAAPSAPAGVPGAVAGPKAEWAAEAIANSRHVVAGISSALIIEGAVALALYATWSLWQLR